MRPIFYLAVLILVTVLSNKLYKLFLHAENGLNYEAKKKLSLWLLNISSKRINENWPVQFVNLFEAMFTKNHLSMACFYRSFVVSTFAYFFTFIFYAFYLGVPIFDQPLDKIFDIFSYSCIFILFYNVIPDYLSLFETRALIKLLIKSQEWWKRVLILIADALLTFLILTAYLYLFIKLFEFKNTGYFSIDFWKFSTRIWLTIFGHQPNMAGTILYIDNESLNSVHVFLISGITTFVTSIWLWLFILSSIIIKIIALAQTYFGIPFIKFFKLEKHPLIAIWFIFCLIIYTLTFFVIIL